MSDHIVDLLGDYLEDRLDRATCAAVEAHVSGCRDCAADLAFARALRAQGEAARADHLAPERIVAIVTGEVPISAGEKAHLDACTECSREAAWVRATPPVPEVARGSARRRVVAWAAGITAVAAVVATLVLMPSTPDPARSRSLARYEALPVHVVRGGEAGQDPASLHRARGLEAYADGRYEDAAVELRPIAAAADAETRLYLGSALLMLQRPDEARLELEAAASGDHSPAFMDLALWQLANAQLAGGDGAAARLTLQRLRDLGGIHASAAGDLLAALE